MIAPSAVRLIKSLSVSDLPLVGQEVLIQSILSDLHRYGCVLVETSGRRDEFSLSDLTGCPKTALYGILTQPDIIRLLMAGANLTTLGVGEAVANSSVTFYTISGLVDPLSLFEFMVQHQVNYLPVLDDHDRILGVVTRERLQQITYQHQQTFVSQSLDGVFLVMLDQPIEWPHDHEQNALREYVFDNLRVTWANAAILDHYGCTEEEFIGLTLRDFFAHDLDYGWGMIQEVFSQGKLHIETDERRKDGSQVWIEGDYTCLYDEQGRITGHVGIQRDITQQRNTQTALQQSEERLRLATGLTETGSWDFDLKTGQAIWSDSHYRLMGLDPETVSPSDQVWRDRVHPEDVEWVEAAFWEAFNQHKLLSVEYRVVHPDGTLRWVLTKGQGVYDDTGQGLRMVGVMLDITNRKQIEAELEARNRELRLAQHIARIGSWSFDPVVGVPAWSEEVYYIYERNPELGPYPLSDYPTIYKDVWWETFHTAITRAMDQGIPYDIELKLDLPSGRTKWVRAICEPLPQRGPKGHSLCGTIQDVTKLKQHEHDLRRRLQIEQLLNQITQAIQQSLPTEEILTLALEALQSWIAADRVIVYQLQADRSGQIVAEAVSDPQYSLLAEVITDSCFLTTRHESYQQTSMSKIDDVSQAEIEPCCAELLARLQVKANLVVPVFIGTHLWGLLIAHHCRGPRHWEDWIEIIMQQLAQHLAIALQQAQLLQEVQHTNHELRYQIEVRNAELQQMLDFEQLLRNMIEQIRSSVDQDEILVTTAQSLGVELNLGACYICLLNPESGIYEIRHAFTGSLRTRPEVIYHPDPQVLAELKQGLTVYYTTDHLLYGPCTGLACPIILQTEGFMGYLKLFRPPRKLFLQAEIRLAEQAASQCAIGIRQARLHLALLQQVDHLTEMNQLKDDFLNMVSHELRTPLTSMRMALQLIDTTDVNMRQRHYLNILRQEYYRELDLVNNLLDLQRMEAGRQELNLSSIILPDWIYTVLEPFQLRFQERNQHLITELPSTSLTLTTDLHLFQRILSELLNNACKYTPPHESIKVHLHVQDSQIQLAVINTGVEIPPEHLCKIFDKFHRVSDLDYFNQGGSGLGLPLIKKATELLGGQLDVSSQNGSTCFTLSIRAEQMVDPL